MNNTFSFNRFKNLLLNDGKMYFRKFGTSLIVFCCLNAIFWIINLLFGTETNSMSRFGFLCVWKAFAMMMVPEKVYGKANLSREGVGFAMMPTSSLEKFISMFLYCAILTPLIVFFGGYLVDALLSLFPFGGFEKPIHLYGLNELVKLMNDSEGVVQAGGEMEFPIESVFPVGLIRTGIIFGIIQWAAIFMLGNMIFKKHKTVKTFACYLGIGYLISMIMGLVFLNRDIMENWINHLSDLPTEQQITVFHNGMVWSLVFSIIITGVLLFFTYRKIKTQKY